MNISGIIAIFFKYKQKDENIMRRWSIGMEIKKREKNIFKMFLIIIYKLYFLLFLNFKNEFNYVIFFLIMSLEET